MIYSEFATSFFKFLLVILFAYCKAFRCYVARNKMKSHYYIINRVKSNEKNTYALSEEVSHNRLSSEMEINEQYK